MCPTGSLRKLVEQTSTGSEYDDMHTAVSINLRHQKSRFYMHTFASKPKEPNQAPSNHLLNSQLPQILSPLHNHSPPFQIRSPQNPLIRSSELRRRERSPLLSQRCIRNHKQAQIDLVETDVGILVVETRHISHRVEGALRQARSGAAAVIP
jgi:hypothetical protein